MTISGQILQEVCCESSGNTLFLASTALSPFLLLGHACNPCRSGSPSVTMKRYRRNQNANTLPWPGWFSG